MSLGGLVMLAGCAGRVRAPLAGATGAGATFTQIYDLQVMTEWDPAMSYSNEVIAMNNMYEQLVRYNSVTEQVEPLLATSWNSAPDGLTWTFVLRPGASFHSGRAVNAPAAKAALDRTIEMAGGASYIWSAVESIAAPDDSTLVFNLAYPSPIDLVCSSAYAAFIYDVEAAGENDLSEWFAKGQEAGSGPYRLAQWNKGQEVELRLDKFAEYWGGWGGAHYERMILRVVPEPTTAAQLLQAGEISFAGQLSPQLWRQVGTYEHIATSERASFENVISMLNTASGPLQDEKLRQAILLAMDYEGLNRALFGSGSLASGLIPEGLLGYQAGLGPRQDIEKARSLLDEAGYGPDGQRVTLQLTRTEGRSALALFATIWQANLADLGIDLQINAMAWESQWDKAKSSNPATRQDIFLFSWFPDYADPFSWFINLFRTEETPIFNLSYFSDPAVDEIIDGLQALTVEDREAAQQTYVALQQDLLDRGVAAAAFVTTYQRAFLKSVTGFVDNPSYANVVFAYDLAPGALT